MRLRSSVFGSILAAAACSAAIVLAQTPAKPATQTPPATPKPAGQKPPATKPATAKPAAQKPAAPKPAAINPALRTPAKLKDVAPATYTVNFDTTAGPFVVQVTRAWAPKGADRFYNLVKYGFFTDARFFRVVPNFVVQFGIHGDPKISAAWREANITDDPVTQSNRRGYLVFATAGPNTRTTQLFINFRDNAGLDAQGFAPFGQVVSGMEAVDKINAEYGQSPDQGRIQGEGNTYLMKEFPKLDYIRKATLAAPPKPAPPVKK